MIYVQHCDRTQGPDDNLFPAVVMWKGVNKASDYKIKRVKLANLLPEHLEVLPSFWADHGHLSVSKSPEHPLQISHKVCISADDLIQIFISVLKDFMRSTEH